MNNQFASLANEFRQQLIANNVLFSERECFDGIQWKFPFTNGDVILHSGSYHNDTCVESYCMPWDRGDVTALPPERMAKFLANYAEWDALDPEDITDEDVGAEEYDFADLLQSVATIVVNGIDDEDDWEEEDEDEEDDWDD